MDHQYWLWLPEHAVRHLPADLRRVGAADLLPYCQLHLSELVRVRAGLHNPSPVVGYGVRQFEDAGLTQRKIRPCRLALEAAGYFACDEHAITREFDPAGVGKCYDHTLARRLLEGAPRRVAGDHAEVGRKVTAGYQERVRKRRARQDEINRRDPVVARVYADMIGYQLPAWLTRPPHHPTVRNLEPDVRWCHRDETAGRLHTSVGALRRAYRPGLTHPAVKGRLGVADIAAAQPQLLAYWSLRGLGDRCPDTDRFIRDCISGRLYERLARAANEAPGREGDWVARDPDERRGQRSAKREAIACLYDRPHRMLHRSPVGRAMLRLYPALFARVLELRAGTAANQLALDMQALEARIVIDGALPELHALYPEVPWIPIHDGILGPASLLGEASEALNRHWQATLTAEGVGTVRPPRITRTRITSGPHNPLRADLLRTPLPDVPH